jgi:uncharacterized protein (TIGR02453 family)
MAKRAVLESTMYPPFEGFSDETMTFLRDLEANNNREWFAEHKQDFDSYATFPMKCFIAALGERLHSQNELPDMVFDPVRSLYRIYRDTRFSKDKTPYKTHIAAMFAYNNRPRNGVTGDFPGLYVQITPEEIWLGGGLYAPSSEQLRAVRHSIANDGKNYLRAVNDPDFVQHYGGVQGEMLKKAPQGTDPTHPMIEHLRRKQFFAIAKLPSSAALQADFVDTAAGYFIAIQPLLTWLQTVLRA